MIVNRDWSARKDTATHCNALQRTATRCITLQHTATHYNAQALHDMLVNRDWSALKDTRVDRRYSKLGKIAQVGGVWSSNA